jgi:hypothetical protein
VASFGDTKPTSRSPHHHLFRSPHRPPLALCCSPQSSGFLCGTPSLLAIDFHKGSAFGCCTRQIFIHHLPGLSFFYHLRSPFDALSLTEQSKPFDFFLEAELSGVKQTTLLGTLTGQCRNHKLIFLRLLVTEDTEELVAETCEATVTAAAAASSSVL